MRLGTGGSRRESERYRASEKVGRLRSQITLGRLRSQIIVKGALHTPPLARMNAHVFVVVKTEARIN